MIWVWLWCRERRVIRRRMGNVGYWRVVISMSGNGHACGVEREWHGGHDECRDMGMMEHEV